VTDQQPDPNRSRFYYLACRSRNAAHILQRPKDYRGFVHVLGQACGHQAIGLFTYAVLSNEWHALIETPGPDRAVEFFARVATTHDA